MADSIALASTSIADSSESEDPTARVDRPLARRHEPEEQLADGFPAGGLSGGVQVLGAGGEGPADAADLAVRLEREAPVMASIVELGERVLDERQGAGLLRDVRRDLGDERPIDLRPECSAGRTIARSSSSGVRGLRTSVLDPSSWPIRG